MRGGLAGYLIFQSIRLGEGPSTESPNSKKSPPLDADHFGYDVVSKLLSATI